MEDGGMLVPNLSCYISSHTFHILLTGNLQKIKAFTFYLHLHNPFITNLSGCYSFYRWPACSDNGTVCYRGKFRLHIKNHCMRDLKPGQRKKDSSRDTFFELIEHHVSPVVADLEKKE